jgi:hypothetical protein
MNFRIALKEERWSLWSRRGTSSFSGSTLFFVAGYTRQVGQFEFLLYGDIENEYNLDRVTSEHSVYIDVRNI